MARFSVDNVNEGNPLTLGMEPGDDVVICLDTGCDNYESFIVSTLVLPTGRTALRVTFDGYFEDERGSRYLFDDSTGAEELVLEVGGKQVRLKRH